MADIKQRRPGTTSQYVLIRVVFSNPSLSFTLMSTLSPDAGSVNLTKKYGGKELCITIANHGD